MSLRTFFASSVAVLVALVLIAAASLATITTFLHTASRDLRAALLRADAASELESALLATENSRLRARTGVSEPPVPCDNEVLIRERLEGLRGLITGPRGEAVFARLRDDVEAYLTALKTRALETTDAQQQREMQLLDEALASAQEMEALGAIQAQEAMRSAQTLDAVANIIAVTVGALLVAVLLVLLVLIQRKVYRPLVEIRSAIERFGRGNRHARAPEAGPTELAGIARTFNSTAELVERQLNSMAMVAHDLRNPLAALSTAMGTVRDDRPLPSEEQLRRVTALARRQVVRLDRMVGDLLDVARIEAGRLELKLADCDLRSIATDVVELFTSESTRHELRLALPETPVAIRCDAGRLEQALGNLVSNAIKYSPEGGKVTVTVGVEGDEAILAVTDEGLGIPPEEQERIFEPFRRSPTSREAVPGTGLGLSITRRIVESHGGRLELESEPGKGSTFRARLPRQPPTL